MIKIKDVEKAQEKWGEGIVAISEIYRSDGDYAVSYTHLTLPTKA